MNEGTLPPAGQLSPAWVDFFIVLGVIVLVTLGLMFWALVFSTKARHRRHRHRHHHHHKSYREEIKKGTDGLKQIIQQGRHHHRHEHRPLNPTLAETGGLPPVRSPERPPPSPPPSPP